MGLILCKYLIGTGHVIARSSVATTTTPTKTRLVELPIELVTLILARLPVKTLLGFKSVSKEWNSLISSDDFAKIQMNYSPKGGHIEDHLLICLNEKDYNSGPHTYLLKRTSLDVDKPTSPIPAAKLFIPAKNGLSHLKICCSCNGWIILLSQEKELYMWNSTSSISNIAIRDGGGGSRSSSSSTILAFAKIPRSKTLAQWDLHFSLGYDKEDDDYKLVKFATVSSKGKRRKKTTEPLDYTSSQIYNMKRKSWGEHVIVQFDDDGFCKSCEDGWRHTMISFQSDTNKLIDNHIINFCFGCLGCHRLDRIRGFDISSEKWIDVPCPPSFDRTLTPQSIGYYLGVFDNCLCMDIFSWRDSVSTIWIMKEYGVEHSWTKLLSFSVPINDAFIDITSRPIAYSKGCAEVLIQILYNGEGVYYWYSIKDKVITSRCRRYPRTHIIHCVASLVSLE